jgi:TatA/E family protein of Tat protein translocase
MPNLGAPELIVLALVVVVLFGWKKLPDMARSLGRSARVFKSEVNEMKQDGKPTASEASQTTVPGDVVTPAPTSQAPSQAPSQGPTVDPTRDQSAPRTDGPVA